jgi:DNA-binding PadR family transcriptional regulator
MPAIQEFEGAIRANASRSALLLRRTIHRATEGMAVETRFTEPSVLILTSLAGGPKHGYALIKDIEELAGTTLGPGTLYGALARLEQRGLVEALPAQERRRPYRITPAGARTVRTYLEHVQHVSVIGLKRLAAFA